MISRLLLLAVFASLASAVDRSNFKTCSDSGFCKRLRHHSAETSPYRLLLDNVHRVNESIIQIPLAKAGLVNEPFVVEVIGLRDTTMRVRVIDPIVPRFELHDTLPYGFHHAALNVEQQQGRLVVSSDSGSHTSKLIMTANPMRFDYYVDDELQLVLNAAGGFEFERTKIPEQKGDEEAPPKEEPIAEAPAGSEEGFEHENVDEEAPPPAEANSFEETFKGHIDSQKRGHQAISVDMTFIDYDNLYGIPEHADSLRLHSTAETDPYRMYNLDVFEYELHSPMAIYGASPFMLAHNVRRTVGVFFNNPSEMWIDVEYQEADAAGRRHANTQWLAESGVVDLFLFGGPDATDVLRQFTGITGRPFMPQYFSIGYHQSRWNYNDERDVREVDANFDAYDIPYDVLWLDIEHTKGKMYMTWDREKFPNPIEMQQNLTKKGRKMVTIIDPHIKKDSGYHVYSEALSNDYFVKTRDGSVFEGWCWPGTSAYLDFSNPAVRSWYADLYAIDRYDGSTRDLYTWNDMNEPSVFNGPEISMHKDNLHHNGVEHRDIHNIYGLQQVISTWHGQLKRSHGRLRPFVLTRSFFSGVAKYGAVWTGDNMAQWSHLSAATPMLLSMSLGGVPFVGADVGGFFRDPDAELLLRWYQAAAFQPFFRAHAHIDTRRREPWLWDEKTRVGIRAAILRRQALLPYWYTLFYEAHKFGTPPMRPLWWHFPSDAETFGSEDAFLVGSAILVRPVTEAGASSVDVRFPGSKTDIWYDADDVASIYAGGTTHVISTPITKIPVYYRGGSIIPKRERYRRSAQLSIKDPLVLVIAPSSGEQPYANGTVYVDDGETFDFGQGKYVLAHFAYSAGKFHSKPLHADFDTAVWIEKLVILGASAAPASVELHRTGGAAGAASRIALGSQYDATQRKLTVRKPGVNLREEFVIVIRP